MIIHKGQKHSKYILNDFFLYNFQILFFKDRETSRKTQQGLHNEPNKQFLDSAS